MFSLCYCFFHSFIVFIGLVLFNVFCISTVSIFSYIFIVVLVGVHSSRLFEYTIHVYCFCQCTSVLYDISSNQSFSNLKSVEDRDLEKDLNDYVI